MLGRFDGVWSSLAGRVRAGGSWRTPVVMVRKDGVWTTVYQGIPPNMILLYPAASYLQSASDGTAQTAWYGKFPRGTSESAQVGASATIAHDGSEHGACSIETSQYYNLSGLSGYSTHVPYWKHSHTVASHTHSGVVDHSPPWSDVCPVVSAYQMRDGALFLSTSAPTAELVAYAALVGRYMRFGGLGATGGAATHTHAWVGSTSSSNWLSGSGIDQMYPGSAVTAAPYAHTHVASHSLPAANNDPPYCKLRALQWAGGTTGSIHQLPSGTIAFFTSTALPFGWHHYTGLDERIPLGATDALETTGGRATHGHSAYVHTTAGATEVYVCASASSETSWSPQGHTHSFTDLHNTDSTTWPSWVKLYVGVKD